MTPTDALDFPSTREAGLARFAAFLPRAGQDYARLRNFDLPGHPHVSGLSPYLRRRLLTETEVLERVVARFGASAAEKFIQEVFWRSYWKGWLALRPQVWEQYKSGLQHAFDQIQTQDGLRAAYGQACAGETDLDCMNFWAQELMKTGYLHNHARMWFASIWIFTLRLPWELGADFFLRHLLDGDPASNTLGWRWVAGLQTIGKTYLARPDNIAKYTERRFTPSPRDLAAHAEPLAGLPHPPLSPMPPQNPLNPDLPTGLIVHDDDLDLTHLIAATGPNRPWVTMSSAPHHSPRTVSPLVCKFAEHAMQDAVARHRADLGPFGGPITTADDLRQWIEATGIRQIACVHPSVGPAADQMAAFRAEAADMGVQILEVMAPYDRLCWPHATHGFFKFKAKIPRLVDAIGAGGRQGDLFEIR